MYISSGVEIRKCSHSPDCRVSQISQEKKISECQRRELKFFIELFKILRLIQQFSKNYVFDDKFNTRQAGK